MKTYTFEKTISYRNGTKKVEILTETTDENERSVVYEYKTLAECLAGMYRQIKSVQIKLIQIVPV